MSDREKLIELLKSDDCPIILVLGDNMNGLADYLIANGVTVQRWIPVSERLPENGQKVVFFNYSADAVYAGKFNYAGKKGTVWFRVGKTSYPGSYWMPLPEPPKEMDG